MLTVSQLQLGLAQADSGRLCNGKGEASFVGCCESVGTNTREQIPCKHYKTARLNFQAYQRARYPFYPDFAAVFLRLYLFFFVTTIGPQTCFPSAALCLSVCVIRNRL